MSEVVLNPVANQIAAGLCPARIAGMVIGQTDRPGVLTYGTSGTSRQLDGETIFEIGSLTKTFTGLLLADSVVRGELNLEDPLARWLPEAAPRGGSRAVTLLDLATHTSRLPGNLPGFTLRVVLTARSNPFKGAGRQDLAHAAEGARIDAGLGRRFAYSNVGFALLGLVLEAATNRPYGDLLRDRVTTPLGMADTALGPRTADQSRLAIGHLTERSPVEPFDAGIFDAAGGARSTSRDLTRYAAALLDPGSTPLDKAIRLALKPHRSVEPTTDLRTSVGLAWMHDGRSPATIWHNGGAMGMGSWLGLRPSTRRGVAILVNSGWRRIPLLSRLGYAALDDPVRLPR